MLTLLLIGAGTKFYVIQSGQVEISVKNAYDDPLSTPAGYLGAVINTLEEGNFFGERALITGEDRAASIKTTKFTRTFVFDQENIPESSVLSGKKEATEERIAEVDEKYGNVGYVAFPDPKQYRYALFIVISNLQSLHFVNKLPPLTFPYCHILCNQCRIAVKG